MRRRFKYWLLAGAILALSLLLWLAPHLAMDPTGGGVSLLSDEAWQQLTENAQPADDGVPLCWNGVELPFSEGIYRLSQSPDEEGLTGQLTSAAGDLSAQASAWADWADLIEDGQILQVAAKRGGRVVLYQLQISGLPILSITGDELYPKDDPLDESSSIDEGSGSLVLLEPDQNTVFTSQMEWSLRGHSTYWASKHNYHLKLTKANGNKRNASLLGMRSDEDWLLYSLSTDPSRAKEMTCITLWNELAAQTEWDYPTCEMEYVEVYINGSYAGLYGLASPVDKKSLNLPENGKLYKWRTAYLPYMDIAEALDTHTERTWGDEQAVKLLWPKKVQAGDWTPLKNYAIAFLYEQADNWDEALSLVDLRNQIDSALFTQFTCGADNFLTNRMYAQFEPDGPLYRVPWDLNYSLGDASSSYDWLNLRRTLLPDHEIDTLWRLNPEEMTQLLAQRWSELRAGLFTPEHVEELLRKNAELLHWSGAYEREYNLWGENDGVVTHVSSSGGKPTLRSALDLEETVDFIYERTEFLDETMTQYTPPERYWNYWMEGLES